MMNRRQYLKRAGLGLAALAMPGCAGLGRRTSGTRPPNIVLIVSDDQGYNDLGCYGGTEVKIDDKEYQIVREDDILAVIG